MACEHPKLMSINCVIKCAVCGAEVEAIEVSNILGDKAIVPLAVKEEKPRREREYAPVAAKWPK